jgi:endonuclease YncB( thermonuclease family)
MQILPTLLAGAVAILQAWNPSPRIIRSEPLLVRAVIDGDTIDVSTVGRVRLLGIDAPELGRGYDTAAPFAHEAKVRLTSLVLHRWVRLEQEGQALDAYDRHLAYVLTDDGQFINAVLVREGLARVSARAPLTRLPALQRAEAEAQAARRGMWGSAPSIPPTEYTRRSGATKPPPQTYKQPAQKKTNAKKKKKK